MTRTELSVQSFARGARSLCIAAVVGLAVPRAGASQQITITVTPPDGGGVISTVGTSPVLSCGSGRTSCTGTYALGSKLIFKISNKPADKQPGSWTGNCYTEDSTCTMTLAANGFSTRTVGYQWFPASASLVTIDVYSPLPNVYYGVYPTAGGQPQVICWLDASGKRRNEASDNCKMKFVRGTQLTMLADARVTRNSFQSWTNAPGQHASNPCSGTTTNTCNFTANSDVTLAATFGGYQQVTVTSVANGYVEWDAGSCGDTPANVGLARCSVSLAEGSKVGALAHPASGYVFTGWSAGAGDCTGFHRNCSFTVPAGTAVTLTPMFVAQADAYLVELQVKTDVRPNQITCDDGFLLKDEDLNDGITKSDVVKLCARYGPRDSALTGLRILQSATAGASCDGGYTLLSGDLNKGAGGDFLHLCVTNASNGSYLADAIVRVKTSRPKTANEVCDPNASQVFAMVVGDTTGRRFVAETFERFLTLDKVGPIPGDLNGHAGGSYVFLCLKAGK